MKRYLIVFTYSLFLLLANTAYSQDCNLDFSLGNDTTLNCNSNLTLTAPSDYTYEWNTGATTQSIEVSQAGTYSCTIGQVEESVIANGDFSAGNTEFQSDYGYGSGGAFGLLSNEGEYAVVANPADAHNNFAWCFDHTNGNAGGQMIVVNGASFPNLRIWYQQIEVTPNTDYQFSMWATSVIWDWPAQLNAIVNGEQIGETFFLTGLTCNWQNHTAVWNSGTNTSVEIAIVNQSTSSDGNDFAIDDIAFSPVCLYTDEIEVTVPTNPVLTLSNDTTICEATNITLTATSSIEGSTFLWQPGGLQGNSIAVSPTTTTEYTVTATSPQNCDSQPQSVSVTITDPGNYQLNVPDTYATCSGVPTLLDFEISDIGTYSWQPTQWLDDPLIGNPTATVATETVYTVTYTNICGGTQTATTTVSIGGGVIELGPDLELCLGDDYTIILPVGPEYLWQDGNIGNEYTVTESGTYTVIAMINDCPATGTIIINFLDNPQLVEIDDGIVCAGDSYNITLPGPPYHYVWNDGSTDSQRSFSQAGTYSVVVSLNGCESTETFDVEIIPVPEFDLGLPQAICNGESVVLQVDLPGGVEVLWSNGKTSKAILVTTAGIFSATATVDNCSFTDNVTVSILQNPTITLSGPTTICTGDKADITVSQSNYQYLWNDGSTQNSISINKGGIYSIEATDLVTGCIGTASIEVSKLPAPGVNLAEFFELCTGKTKTIVAIPVNKSELIWEDGSTNTNYEITEAGTYSVTATTECGSITKSIVVIEKNCSQTLFIPNTFTPDGDGLNDIFKAIGQGITLFKIQVYNRWGELVFISDDIKTGWNGNFMNNSYFVESGVYSWIVEIEYEDGYSEVKRGSVRMMR